MRFFKFTVILTLEKENSQNYYNVLVPSFPEICTFGASLEEARFMAQDALELVILSRLEEGEEIPGDKKPLTLSKNDKVEKIVISVFHQVSATPAKYVENALFQSP